MNGLSSDCYWVLIGPGGSRAGGAVGMMRHAAESQIRYEAQRRMSSAGELRAGTRMSIERADQGVALASTARAAVRRFLPGSILGLGVGSLLVGLPGSGAVADLVLAGAAVLVPLGLGFVGGLEVIRRRLSPQAEVEGRRSFLAGLGAATGVTALIAAGPFTVLQGMAATFVIGVVLAVLMFLAWLEPSSEPGGE